MSDYKTIDELMAGKAPGSVELVNTDNDRFIPYFKDSAGDWNGLREGGSDYFVPDPAIWQVFTPPPKPADARKFADQLLEMTEDDLEYIRKEHARITALRAATIERPQLWWVKAGGHWILSPGAYSTKEEVMRSHYKCDEARPSGIYAPEEKTV